jgi:glutathione S-transferase
VDELSKVKLHRCSWTFLRTSLDACWKVERQLKAAGIPYETVKHGYGKGQRPEVEALSGQQKLPVIEFADGTSYRAESADMAERIEAGRLFQSQTSGP